jgi:hypothetical protein
MDSNLTRVSGLWVKDGRKGKFFSGQTDAAIPAGAKLLIFRNDKRTSDKSPDYVLYSAPSDSQGDDGSHHRQSASTPARSQQRPPASHDRGHQQQPHSTPAAPRPPLDEDSIPF